MVLPPPLGKITKSRKSYVALVSSINSGRIKVPDCTLDHVGLALLQRYALQDYYKKIRVLTEMKFEYCRRGSSFLIDGTHFGGQFLRGLRHRCIYVRVIHIPSSIHVPGTRYTYSRQVSALEASYCCAQLAGIIGSGFEADCSQGSRHQNCHLSAVKTPTSINMYQVYSY